MHPKTYGLIIRPFIAGEDYVYGSSLNAGGTPLQLEGQWDQYLPIDELQAPGYETNACVSFATTSALEILLNRLYGRTDNFSDRFVAKGSGTNINGNTYQAVMDFIRNQGAVAEDIWPTSAAHSYNEFFAELPSWLFPEAKVFPAEFSYHYDLVPLAYANLKDALKYSPLSVGVYAWELKPGSTDLYHKPAGALPNHAVVLYGYVEGAYWKVFDSYDNTHKKYDWASLPDIAFRHTLTRQVKQESYWQQFVKIMIQIFPFATESLSKLLEEEATSPALPPVVPQEESKPDVPPAEPQKLLWGTREQVRHSVRVICDEEGLTLEEKNTCCATIQAESGFFITARNDNFDGNKVVSSDFGICQINDFYHIGPGKDFPSVEYVLKNPEACVRWMARLWKAGKRNLWSAYNNGSYKRFL